MRTWVASRLWIWLPRIGQVVAVVGGIAMLLAAAMIHQTQVVPSAVIGALWLALAFRGIGQMKASAWTVSIDGEAVMFRGRREVLIPAKDIVEIRRSRGDLNHFAAIQVRTLTHGTILLPARMKGMVELLVELRKLNPGMTIGSNL